VLAIAGAGAVWGVIALTVVPWQRVSPIVSHLSSGMGLPLTALAMALTGGASSPARFYLFFVVVYCSYFYPPREALPHLLGCVAVIALPLAYDAHAVEQGLLGELLVLTPTFLVLGGLIMAGKRVLVELSRGDHLTGVANRRAFAEQLARQLEGRRATDANVGVLLMDLDGFKDANTMYGHPAGDEVLRRTALALRAAVREGDTVARIGGDEFAVIVTGADETGMTALASRVHARLRAADEELELPGFRLSGSLGWALHPRDAHDADELIATADLALRGAKAAGKDRSLSPLDWLPEPAVS
jgi:diguanylate cyclase (GGDEF)-like protein